MRWRQWNTSQELGVASRMCGWRRRASKDRVVLSAMPHVPPGSAPPSSQHNPFHPQPHHSTVQHSLPRQTHTYTPTSKHAEPNQAAQKQTQKPTTPHRPSTHLPRCPRAGTSSCSSPSSFLHLCLSISIAYTCSFHSSNTISCTTPPPPNNTSKRHTDMQTNIGIFISPPHHCECVGGSGTHHKRWGLQAECVDGGDVQAKIELS